MNTRQLEYIKAVADTMSFSEAAKALYVSQPSLSQYVKKVEDEIGTEIFVRTTPLKLTYQGEIFLRFAKKVLAEEKELNLFMEDISVNKIGSVRVGAGPLNSSVVLPKITCDFLKDYSNVKVNISEAVESELIECLDRGEVDLILTVMTPQIPDNYIMEEVAREQYVLAVPQTLDKRNDLYSYKRDAELGIDGLPLINIKECRDLPYIMQTSQMPAHNIFEALCRSEGFLPSEKITVKNINTAIQMANEGLGACFIPSSVMNALDDRINCYRLEGNSANRVIKIIYRRSMIPSGVQQAFMEAIREYYINIGKRL